MKLNFYACKKDLEKIQNAPCNTKIYISGIVYVMRDRAHKLYINDNNDSIDFKNSALFYAGPTENRIFGPTTASRMDPYTEYFASKGVRLFIGKGNRDTKLLKKLHDLYGARYATTYGGLASYLSTFIKKSEIVLYSELGCEAVYKLKLKNFPAILE
ncbi:MAG: fumarate hydratase C-terminal domain-containing protein [Candidatus Muiribacteriota bacterium]